MDIFNFSNMLVDNYRNKFNLRFSFPGEPDEIVEPDDSCKKFDFLEDEAGNLYIYDCFKNNMYGILEKYLVDTEEFSFLSAENAKILKSIDISIDDEMKNWSSWLKYLEYSIRGKRVSPEQAFDVIRRTDEFFRNIYNYVTPEKETEHIYMVHFDNNIIGSHPYGWMHTDGVVGLDGPTTKYPDIWDLLLDFYDIKLNFPYLDFVAIIGSITDSETNAEIGVWLHENKIEFLNPEHAMEKYNQYKKLYEEEDKSIYSSDFDVLIKKKPTSIEYTRKYLEAWGLDPDETLKKLKKDHPYMRLYD